MGALNKVHQRVVVIRPDEIGDVILTSAFLRELRRLLPKAWICLIVKPGVYNIVELCPYIDKVLTYDWTSNQNGGRLRRIWRSFRFARHNLRPEEIDTAILPRWNADSIETSCIAFFSNATRRLGYSENVARDGGHWNRGFNLLLTDVLTDSDLKHDVQRGLDIVRFLGGTVQNEKTEFWLNSEDELFAQRLMKSERIEPGEPIIAFGVGKRHPKRMWPIENFVALGKGIIDTYGARILVLGDDKDAVLGRELRQRLGAKVIDLTGKSTLRESAATLKHCTLYVGNDTGPMHMAAAVNVPVVMVSCHPVSGSRIHPNSPLRFGPWNVPSVIVQPASPLAPCVDACSANEAHCIRQIHVDEVRRAVAKLMETKITGKMDRSDEMSDSFER